jgi:hypothetical protein
MKHKKPFAINVKRELLEALFNSIQILIQTKPNDDDDKLLFATLEEVRHRIYMKLDKVQISYRISFQPAQAFALRILGNDYFTDRTTQLGNMMKRIAEEVHKHYS